jgi:hypothetical protein
LPRADTRDRSATGPTAALYLAAGLVLLGLLTWQHWQIISVPVPLDYYEGTQPLITGIIAGGDNPFTRERQPMAADVYPPLYNLLAAPLSGLFGNSLAYHRAISALFIVASCLLCLLALRRRGSHWAHAIAAVALIYAALLYYATPVASTNGTGMFFFLASVLVPWLDGFRTRSLAWSIGLGVSAFYSKQYFAAGMLFVAAQLLLTASIRAALLYSLSVAGLLLGSLALVHWTSPYYLDNTLWSVQAAARLMTTSDTMLLQLAEFIRVYAALLVLLALAAVRRWRSETSVPRLNLTRLNEPLSDYRPDFLWLCFVGATFLIVLLLGHNPANWMTYLFQLMSPFLLMATFRYLQSAALASWLVIPLVLVTFYNSYSLLQRDFTVDRGPWQDVGQVVESSEEILASPILTALLVRQGKEVFQDGHTFYFPLAAEKPAWFVKREPESRVGAVWDDYIRELYRRVESRQFDVVLATGWDINGFFTTRPHPDSGEAGDDIFRRHYRHERTVTLSMTDRPGAGTHRIQVWRPRSAPPRVD